MTLKEIHDRAGSLPGYAWYIFLVFCWYFMDNIYTSIMPLAPDNFIEPLLQWGYRIVIIPFLAAGVYGGIRKQQRTEDITSLSAFFHGVKTNYWRMMGANLLTMILIMVVAIVALLTGSTSEPDFSDNQALRAVVSIPYSAISLFWFTGIVMERKIFLGLFRGIKVLLSSPFAMALGIAWGVTGFADTFVADLQTEQTAFALNGIRAGVLAMVRVLVTAYAFAVYEKARGYTGDELSEELAIPASTPVSPGDKLARASIKFAFVSFLPVFHLVALVLGALALKCKKQFVLSAAIACCLGGFFTILYSLMAAGWILAAAAPSDVPSYAFLAQINADLEPQATLLEQEAFQEIQVQLQQDIMWNNPAHHWSYDFVSGVSKYQAFNVEGALDDFHVAAGKKPERSEFYYFYGRALLDNGQEEMAAQQFRLALEHEPRLAQAEQYLNLIESTYTPSLVVSSLGFVIILLVSFTLHEYGHALAAWKLGDDTAKNEGRLTLNPVPHLDLFGSLILPAILLFQQAEVMFGWARPVPVNPQNFKDPKKDHMRVSFAGPAMNLLIAMVCLIILGGIFLSMRLLWPDTISLDMATPFSPVSLVGPPFARFFLILIVFLKQVFYTSLVLGFFNLIPVPPLDGSWILSGLLPGQFGETFEKIRRFGFVIFLLLVITPALDYIMSVPIGLAWAGFSLLVFAMGLG